MIWLALYLSLFSNPAVDPELETAVQTFWDLLQKGDKVGSPSIRGAGGSESVPQPAAQTPSAPGS